MSIRRLGALTALILVIASCSAGPGTGGELEGTQWVLSSYNQGGTLTILPETLYADARFDGSRVSGFSGCNEFDALYRSGGRTLLISQARSTMMACDEATMAFEQQYMALLDGSRFYGTRLNTLTIYDADRNTSLVFDAAPRNPLLGKWRVDSYGTTPGTVVAVLPGTQLDVEFGIASIGGFAGCNSFSGTYGTNGTVVRVGRLATTQMACDTDVMSQETAFLAAISGAAVIESRGSQLNLTDRDGRLLVALVRPSFGEPGASASPGPSQTAAASASPIASASPSASPKPTASPTPAPTATPTPTPTVVPSTVPSTRPSVAPPSSLPPTASCKLVPTGGPTVATIVYPGTWSTPAAPPEVVCRYFDPAPISVPADPTTLVTAVRADVLKTPYADAITAATDPASWTVTARSETNVRGTAVTCILATAASDASGIPAGTARYACFANVQTAGTVEIWASGAPGDATFAVTSAVVSLMTMASTFTPPG